VEIGDIAKACGVKFIKVIDPFDFKSAVNTLEKAIKYDGPAVVISRRKCALVSQREKAKQGRRSFLIGWTRINAISVYWLGKRRSCPVLPLAGRQ